MKSLSFFEKPMPKLFFVILLVGLALVVTGCGNTPGYLQKSGTGQYLQEDLAQDKQIGSDISTIRSALLAYAQVEKTFPPSLETLVPTYLEKVPQSPMAGERYSYKADLFTGNYELKYKTSDGIEHTADATTTDLKLKNEFDQEVNISPQ